MDTRKNDLFVKLLCPQCGHHGIMFFFTKDTKAGDLIECEDCLYRFGFRDRPYIHVVEQEEEEVNYFRDWV